MTVVLLDTDVFSYLNASNPNRAVPYRKHILGMTIALSFITIGEQYAGYRKQILKGHWPAARLQKLEANLRAVVVIPYDIEVCRTYGELKAVTERFGRSVAPNDLWIAACAKHYSLTLITNNRSHFESIPGLEIVSEAPDAI